MKCALPGMYGRKIAIQSDAIGGVFKDEMSKYVSPDTGVSFEEVAKAFNQMRDEIRSQVEADTRPQSTKEVEVVNDFEALKQKILKQDAEAHSQK